MRKKILISLFVVFIGFILFDSLYNPASTYSSGPPAGFCGSPDDGYQTCVYCHQGPVPTALPDLITSNIPTSGYIPGDTFSITATIRKPGHTRFGFELSPTDQTGSIHGTLVDTSLRTKLTPGGRYIEHTDSNSTMSADSNSWSFLWVAPASGSGVMSFYGAFNVTNNSGTFSGDTIYTSSLDVQENLTLIDDNLPSTKEIFTYPNPAADHIYLRTEVSIPGKTDIRLFDCAGNNIQINYSENIEKSFSLFSINLPQQIVSGIYYMRINNCGVTKTKKIVVVN